MDSIKPWAKSLGIPPQQLALWQRESPDLNHFTFWCLEKGYLPTKAYLEWAKEYYGLAILSDDFVHENISTEFWNSVKSVSNWSKEFQPICEWDGVIFIACVEPRTDIEWSFPVKYVLASPKFLSRYWKKMHNEEVQITQVSKKIQIDTKTSPAIISEVSTESAAAQSLETANPPAPTVNSDASVESTSLPLEAPAGLTLEVPQFQFDFSNIKLATDSTTSADKSAAVPTSKPTAKPTEKPTAKPTAKPAAMPTEIPITAPTASVSVDPLTSNQKENNQNPQAAAHTQNSIPEDFFGSVLNNFSAAMVLYSKQDAYVPLQWTNQFQAELQPFIFSDLNSPSAFRIVHKTKKPYFGHLVNTPANNDFFNKWGFQALPTCVLLQPIISGSFVIGILLLTCKSDNEPKSQLALAQEYSDNLVKYFSGAASSKAAS